MEMPAVGNLGHRTTAYCLFSAEDCIERKKWTFPLTVKAEERPEAAYSGCFVTLQLPNPLQMYSEIIN